jgi:arylsulfatase A-like enzyme
VPAQNFVVVLLDDVGIDRVGAYGAHPEPGRTPTLDALAAQGLLFRNAWAMPTCSPTRASVLTGRFPSRHGVGEQISATTPGPQLDPQEVIIPEALPGYSSAAIGKWHLRSVGQPPTHPLDVGFEHHAGSMYNISSGGYWNWTKWVDGVGVPVTEYATTETTDDALRAIAHLAEPYFLYLNYNAAHAPFHVPPQHLHTYGFPDSAPRRMRAMVEALDTELARFLAAVDLSDTYVLVMGDNGTPRPASDGPFLPEHAKGTLYQGGVQVPLIVAGPGVGVGETDALVSCTDLFAMVLELAGAPPAPTAEDSLSFASVLASPAHAGPRRLLYAESFGPGGGQNQLHRCALSNGRFKLLRDIHGDELYDLAGDRFEAENLLQHAYLPPHQRRAYARLVAALPVFP